MICWYNQKRIYTVQTSRLKSIVIMWWSNAFWAAFWLHYLFCTNCFQFNRIVFWNDANFQLKLHVETSSSLLKNIDWNWAMQLKVVKKVASNIKCKFVFPYNYFDKKYIEYHWRWKYRFSFGEIWIYSCDWWHRFNSIFIFNCCTWTPYPFFSRENAVWIFWKCRSIPCVFIDWVYALYVIC